MEKRKRIVDNRGTGKTRSRVKKRRKKEINRVVHSQQRKKKLYNIPSTPSATKSQANQLTCRSSSFQVSSPTCVAYSSKCFSSVSRARRKVGEEVIITMDSSVSSVSDRVERFDEPTNVRNGFESGGETQSPEYKVNEVTKKSYDNAATDLLNDMSILLSPTLLISRRCPSQRSKFYQP